MTAKPLTDSVEAGWAEALAPVAGDIAALGDFLRAEIAEDRGYLPAGANVLRAFRQPFDDVQWQLQDGLLAVRSPRLGHDGWWLTSDLATADGAGFHLRGRADRIVKIEEKRVSLGAVERRLAAAPWIAEARAADAALVMITLASVGFASNQWPICSLQTRCTNPLTSVLPSLVLVWPSNCGSPTLTEMTAAKPSRQSSPERLPSLSLMSLCSLA